MRRSGLPLLLAALLLVSAAPPARAAGWLRPVSGPVARGFDLGPDPFERGRHRGADLAVAVGAEVRAACGGRVIAAGPVGSSGRVVSVRCGAWRVSYLPLAVVAVRKGTVIVRGDRLGTTSAGARHAGLHFGVRREGRRFGYVDPLGFLGEVPAPLPLVGGRAGWRRGPRPLSARGASREAAPAPGVPPLALPAPAPLSAPALAPAAAPTLPLAPWPAWLGLALLLAGAAGSVGGRHRRRPRPIAVAHSPVAPEPVR